MNVWVTRIQNYYQKGYYTNEQVQVFVPQYISQEECNRIINNQ